MDLNQLLSRHQISLMRSTGATSPEVRHVHHGLAAGYADQIRSVQQAYGAAFTLAPLA
ncbi:hypothetical protein [Sphingomonas sp. CLY1604]|uniref:hypothetical protein n=1 Tax=Sphingomonas sp. CLY1604 TaxID=3457786 RepID=UPI003FD72E63